MIQPVQRVTIAAFALIAVLLAASDRAAARTPYDGNWSVSIWTDRGTCDRGYRYELRISDGRVSYRGEGAFNASGRVDGGGRVNVTVSRGEQHATGAGRLSRDRGTGSWRGKSSTGECSGTWEAERR
jgi:hypothetical protein